MATRDEGEARGTERGLVSRVAWKIPPGKIRKASQSGKGTVYFCGQRVCILSKEFLS